MPYFSTVPTKYANTKSNVFKVLPTFFIPLGLTLSFIPNFPENIHIFNQATFIEDLRISDIMNKTQSLLSSSLLASEEKINK